MNFLKVNRSYSFGLLVGIISLFVGLTGIASAKSYEYILTSIGSSYANPILFLCIGMVAIAYFIVMINKHQRVKNILARQENSNLAQHGN
jgi:nitrate/nitrite transporter NarK